MSADEILVTPEQLAQLFHETYEELAPQHGYATRKRSAVQEALAAQRRDIVEALGR